MHHAARISVVISAFNVGSFLRETLDSALAQTLPAHEIIIVDDGSTDDTAAIAQSYGDAIRYIYQDNQGVSVARNTGIRAATGDWIALLDGDDICLPDRLRATATSIENNPRAVVHYTGFEYFSSAGTTGVQAAFPARELWPALRYRTPILPSTATVLRQELLDNGGFRKVTIEDWDLWFRIMLRHRVEGFQEIPQTLLRYRSWQGSFTKRHVYVSHGMLAMMDDLLLSGLSGLPRVLWRRRIEARIHYELSIELRHAGDPLHTKHALISLLKWPLYGKVVPARRYKVLANNLYKSLQKFARYRRGQALP